MINIKRERKIDYVDTVNQYYRINRVKYVRIKNAKRKRQIVALESKNVDINVMDSKEKRNV